MLGAVGWQTLATVATLAVQTGITLIGAAATDPRQFALWGVASVIFNAQYLVGTLGIGPALVFDRDDLHLRDAVDAAVLLSGAIAFVCTLLLYILAPNIASVFVKGFSRNDVIDVIRIMSLVFAIMTLSSVPQALIERSLVFRDRAIPDVIAVTGYALVAGFLLAVGVGVWSLILARLVQSSLLLVLYWRHSPVHPHRLPRIHFERTRSLLKYGKFFTVAAWVGFFTANLDNVAVGKWVGAAALGAYALAFSVANIVPTIVAATLGRVFFPVFAALRGDTERLARSARAALHAAGWVLLPATAVLLTIGPSMLVALFGQGWRGTGPILRVLAIYGLARGFGSLMADLDAATGRPDVLLRAQALALGVPLALLWFALPHGAAGIAGAFAAGQVMSTMLAWWYVRNHVDVIAAMAAPLGATGCASVAAVAVRSAGGVWAALVAFCLSYGLLVVIANPSLWRISRELRKS